MPIPSSNPIVVAPSPTPFKADDSVDYAAIERNVEKWIKTPLSGFVLNSENGEEQFLSEAERLEIVRTVNNARNGEKFIVGGVDSSSVTVAAHGSIEIPYGAVFHPLAAVLEKIGA